MLGIHMTFVLIQLKEAPVAILTSVAIKPIMRFSMSFHVVFVYKLFFTPREGTRVLKMHLFVMGFQVSHVV